MKQKIRDFYARHSLTINGLAVMEFIALWVVDWVEGANNEDLGTKVLVAHLVVWGFVGACLVMAKLERKDNGKFEVAQIAIMIVTIPFIVMAIKHT